MVATRVGKDKSQRSTIKIMNEIRYLEALPSSQVLNCLPAPYNHGFVGGGGDTGKEFISKAGESNNLFMWNFFPEQRTGALGNISKMKLHKGKSSPFVFCFALFSCRRCMSITNCCHIKESSRTHST